MHSLIFDNSAKPTNKPKSAQQRSEPTPSSISVPHAQTDVTQQEAAEEAEWSKGAKKAKDDKAAKAAAAKDAKAARDAALACVSISFYANTE